MSMCSGSPIGTSADSPRASQVSAAGRVADSLSKFAGLWVGRQCPALPRPAFMKTRYSEPIAVGDRPADNLLGLAHGEKHVPLGVGEEHRWSAKQGRSANVRVGLGRV
jgi:hypothetical protein